MQDVFCNITLPLAMMPNLRFYEKNKLDSNYPNKRDRFSINDSDYLSPFPNRSNTLRTFILR